MSTPPHRNTAVAASKFAQLLGEVIIHHAPWTADIAEDAKRRRVESFLEELEDHTADIMGPLLTTVAQTGNVPPELSSILGAIATPEHQVSAIASQFLVFGVGFQLGTQLLAPFMQVVANNLWAMNPTKPLDPSVLATMAVRGIDPATTSITPVPSSITSIAAMSGVSAQNMQALADAVGSPPAPEDLFQMIRRGMITEDQLTQGMREGDTRDEWIPYFTKLRYTTPTPVDLVRAAIQAQMPYDEANSLALELGLEPPGYINDNPDWFQLLFDVAGRPPGPQEVGRMANRGIVPWTGTGADVTSFAQAIAESDVKTKWTDALQAIETYWPAPEEVRGLYQAGGITIEQAEAYWQGSGVPDELVKALSHQAQIQQIEQERALNKGDIVKALYDGILDDEDATDLLSQIGYTGQVAKYIIELTDQRREIRAIDMAVRRVGSLYVNYKLTAADATASLDALGVADAQAQSLLNIWTIERTPETRLPSIAQLGRAVQYSGFPFVDAVAGAVKLGYTTYDATVVIAAESEQPPPGGFGNLDDTGVQI
jgi:hypothetical protein